MSKWDTPEGRSLRRTIGVIILSILFIGVIGSALDLFFGNGDTLGVEVSILVLGVVGISIAIMYFILPRTRASDASRSE